ncbi:MAG: hypothetical protein L0H84_02560 [Pseudonocardia sp.]|nr:hypothetical protein [Pseudonocardia sp.]
MTQDEHAEPTDPDSVGANAAETLDADEGSPAASTPDTAWAGRARSRRDGPQQTKLRRRR